MKAKTKKLLTIFSAAIMLFSSTACSSGNQGGANDGANTVTSEQAQSASAETVAASTAPEDTANAEASETSENIETTVNPEQQPNEETSETSATSETAETSDTPKTPENTETTANPEQQPNEKKILVAYFSATGTTESIALKLAEGIGADIYEIVPEEPYTSEDLDYVDRNSRSTLETNDPDARPAISGSVENMEQYDTVLIGYPIWWGDAPRIMSTFIESYDFSEKNLAAFCTSSSSGFGSSDSALKAAASSAVWLKGIRFSANAGEDEILAWANGLGISG